MWQCARTGAPQIWTFNKTDDSRVESGRWLHDWNLSIKLRAKLEVEIGKLKKDKRSLEQEGVAAIGLMPPNVWSIVQISRTNV